MEYNVLNESEKLQVVKGYNSNNKNLCLLKTSIVTDGNVSFCVDYAPQPVLGYSYGDYKNPYVDTLAKSELEIEGASYVIKSLIAKDLVCLNGESTFVDTIKNVEVFLKDLENEQTLKKVESEIKRIYSSYRKDIAFCNNSVMNNGNVRTRKKQ